MPQRRRETFAAFWGAYRDPKTLRALKTFQTDQKEKQALYSNWAKEEKGADQRSVLEQAAQRLTEEQSFTADDRLADLTLMEIFLLEHSNIHGMLKSIIQVFTYFVLLLKNSMLQKNYY